MNRLCKTFMHGRTGRVPGHLAGLVLALFLFFSVDGAFGMGLGWPPSDPTVNFTTASQTVSEDTGVAVITVELSESSSSDVSVPFIVSGTADGDGVDYTLSASTAVIPSGQLSVDITVTINADADGESDETVIFTMDTPTNANAGETDEHTLTITEGPVVNFSIASQTISEDTGTAVITVELSGALSTDVSVPFTVSGTADGDGVDYTLSASPAVIPSGQLSVNITVEINADADEEENDETVIVTMGTPTNAVAGTTTEHTLTITEELTVNFSIASQTISEDTGTAVITVELSGSLSSDVSVPFTVSGTADGDGVDYTLSASPAVIPSGQLSVDIPVTINTDGVEESNETVIVTMGTPTNAIAGTTAVHILTITDVTYDWLASFSSDFESPTDVAVDADGSMYVSDSYGDSVTVLSQSGKFIAILEGLEKPISVAVDADKKLYVANLNAGNVQVFDNNFEPLFKLGSGNNEFQHPRDIAIAQSGTIYVADMDAGTVSMYNSSGNYIELLGGPGQGDGEFFQPLSITFDNSSGEIIILDRASGGRVQFFDQAGSYLRSFYGASSTFGGMVRPQHIVVDELQRLYVSDSGAGFSTANNVVLVYDYNGDFLDAIYDNANPVITPLGMYLSETNRLYVTSRITGKVEVYGLEEYTNMLVDPGSLTFTVQHEGDQPSSQSFTVQNGGNVELNWSATEDVSWLSLSDAGGALSAGQSAQVDVTVDITGLAAGEYTGEVSFSAGQGAIEVVQVVLNVNTSAHLSVSPLTLPFSSEIDSGQLTDAIIVSNTGSGPMNWSLESDQSWLTVSNSAGYIAIGGDDYSLDVTVDTDMAAGIYTGTITVSGVNAFTGEDALGSSAVVDVTLTLTDPVPGPVPTPSDRVIDDMTWALHEKNSKSLHDVWSSSESDVYIVGQGGILLHFDGENWDQVESLTSKTIYSIWGSSRDDVFAVGAKGNIFHYDGTAWGQMDSPTNKRLYGVYGLSNSEVYAVGQKGTFLHYDGVEWQVLDTPTRKNLYDVWGSIDHGFYAVGSKGTILYYNGGSFYLQESSTNKNLYAIWGDPDELGNIYAVGKKGTVVHYNGMEKWKQIATDSTKNFYGIWGMSPSDFYVAGQKGSIMHYDGTQWSEMNSGSSQHLYGIYGNAGDDIYAVGKKGTILYYDGTSWDSLLAEKQSLYGVWGETAEDVFVVGNKGTIRHYDGSDWNVMASQVTDSLYGVWGSSGADVFSVGLYGTILHYDGNSWSLMNSPTTNHLYGVWGSSDTNVYAVGKGGTILYYDGVDWDVLESPTTDTLYGVWGSSDSDIFAVGTDGAILYSDGSVWSTMISPTTKHLYDVWGSSPTNVFAVGKKGTMLEYDGTVWGEVVSGTGENLYGVWASSGTDAFIVGQKGTLLYYDGLTAQSLDTGMKNWLKDVWGSSTTTDVFAVGKSGVIYHGKNE